MEYNEVVLKELDDYIENIIHDNDSKFKSSDAVKDKLEHIKNTVNFAKMVQNSNPLLVLATKFHDIGRFRQIELIGNFNDNILSHLSIGEDYILRDLSMNRLSPSLELDMIRLVVHYHGRTQFIPNRHLLLPEMVSLVEDVSNIDEIENGCIGAIGYLEREARDDVKGYRANNPNLDMKSVSDGILNDFLAGNKFDKIICKTYAEYILFAAVLAIQSLKGKNQDLAKKAMEMPCFGHNNALEGYKYIFDCLIDPSISKICIDTLYDFYHNANESSLLKTHTLLKKNNN